MTEIDAPDSAGRDPGRRRGAPDALPPGYRDGGEYGAGRDGGTGDPGYSDPAGFEGGPLEDGAAYPPDGQASRGGPAHRMHHAAHGRRRHPVLLVLAIIVVLLVVLVGGGLLWAERQINPGGKPGAYVTVDIAKDASTSQIGSDLAAAGVIHNATLFRLYVKFHDDGPLYPGQYRLQKNSSYQTAINALETGPKIVTEKLVIPEGYTLRQIAAAVGALPEVGLSASKFLSAAEEGSVRSPYEPAGVNNLEGLLFPATYEVSQGESEVDVLETMIEAFDERAESLGLESAAAHLHETPYQLVTVASIVEREAKFTQDKGPVASTLYNRLHIGMPLGADSTQTYYLRLSHPDLLPSTAQLNEPSPYNTRLNTGLPPTPISNPGIPSLQAATSPPSTNYLYFVEVNPDGKLGFASTEAGFQQLQAECRAARLC